MRSLIMSFVAAVVAALGFAFAAPNLISLHKEAEAYEAMETQRNATLNQYIIYIMKGE